MKKANTTKKDKLMAPPATTGSTGLSTSANITVGFAGPEGDDSNSLFPDFHEEKSWSSKTTPAIDHDR